MPTFANDDNGNVPKYYVPVTLTNNQSSNVATGTQVLIQINSSNFSSYEATNLINLNWQDGAGNLLYSWLESGETSSSTVTNYWVKLNAAINASGGTLIVYLVFYPTSATSFSTNHTGAEPTYTATYAQYDNGINVFNLYDNFNGTTLSSLWTTENGGNITVNNGITVGYSNGSTTAIKSANTTLNPSVLVCDTYSKRENQSSIVYPDAFQNGWQTDTTPQYGIGQNSTPAWELRAYNGSSSTAIISGTADTNMHILTLSVLSSSATGQIDYGTIATASGAGFTLTTSAYLEPLSTYGQGGSNNPTTFTQWVRLRNLPPLGVLPTSSVGSITSLGANVSGSASASAAFILSQAASATGLGSATATFLLSQIFPGGVGSATAIPSFIQNQSTLGAGQGSTSVSFVNTANLAISESAQASVFILSMSPLIGQTNISGDFALNFGVATSFDSPSFQTTEPDNYAVTYLPPNTNVQSVSASLASSATITFTYNNVSSYTSPTITTTITDSASTNIPGVLVSWTSSNTSAATVSPASATTNSSGVATTTVTGTGATITATTVLLGVTKTSTVSV